MAGPVARAVDAIIGVFSPSRAARRRLWRRVHEDPEVRKVYEAMTRARGYRAASASPQKWVGSESHPDLDRWDIEQLRKRASELERDDSVGSGIIKTFVDNVVGRGLTPQVKTGDPEKDRRLESFWRERADELHPADGLTYSRAQRMKLRRALVDGDVLVKAVTERGPLTFDIIEARRVMTPIGEIHNPQIRGGVERDSTDVPIAYHVQKYAGHHLHGYNPLTTYRVEAHMARLMKDPQRPGQSRGVSFFHAVLQDIRDLDLLLLASLKRVQIAACLSLFIESPLPTPTALDVTAQTEGYKLDQQIEPGMIFKLFPGEKVTSLVPNFPTPELVPFTIVLAKRIGVSLGISWQSVLRDWSGSNYSSARTTLLDDRRTYQVLTEWLIEQCTWEWLQVIEDGRLRGDERLAGVTDEDIRAVQWIHHGWQWVDPQKEALGAEIRLRLGLTTLRAECAAQGNDWEDVARQRVEEEALYAELRKERGLAASESPGMNDAIADPDQDDDDEDTETEERRINGRLPALSML